MRFGDSSTELDESLPRYYLKDLTTAHNNPSLKLHFEQGRRGWEHSGTKSTFC
jgi:hypothetical protein